MTEEKHEWCGVLCALKRLRDAHEEGQVTKIPDEDGNLPDISIPIPKKPRGYREDHTYDLNAGSRGHHGIHDESCEADWGSEGQESPCRCAERHWWAGGKPPSDAEREILRNRRQAAQNLRDIGREEDTIRHLAAYGSTNALCGETVPQSTAWNTTAAEYDSTRFTAHRTRTTCPECLWRLGGSQAVPVDPAAVFQVISAWLVPGVSPYHHKQMQDRLRHEWPMLANAIDKLTARPCRLPNSAPPCLGCACHATKIGM